MILAYIFRDGQRQVPGRASDWQVHTCRESQCVQAVANHTRLKLAWVLTLEGVAQTPAGGELDIMCTKRLHKTSGVEHCSWRNYVNPVAPIKKCSWKNSVEVEVLEFYICKLSGQKYVKIQALKFDIQDGVAKFR